MTPHEFLDAKRSLAAMFRFRETSGFRPPEENADAGGVTFSGHQVWLATDVVLREGEDKERFKIMATRLGLLALDEGDHFHLQPGNWPRG